MIIMWQLIPLWTLEDMVYILNNISPSWFWLNIARSPLVPIGTMEYLGPHEELNKLVGM